MRRFQVFILILFFCSIQNFLGQTIQLSFSGNVNSGKDSPLKNVLIHFIQKNDTLCVLKSGENGSYACSLEIESRDSFFVFVSKYGFKENLFKIDISDSSIFYFDFDFDFSIYKIHIFNNDPSIYFNKNETKDMSYVDLKQLENFTIEYPHICIRYTQTIHPNESKRIAKKRMNNFRKYLIENKINIRNIQFEESYYILNEKQLEKDSRSRIQGIGFSCN